MNKRLQFNRDEQIKYFQDLESRSALSVDDLAKIAKVHPRSFRDWKRAKLSPTLSAVRIFSKRFGVDLPEEENILLGRWFKNKIESSRKGGFAKYRRYGLATEEGRRKGGLQSAKMRKLSGLAWAKPIKTPNEGKDLAEFIGIMLGDGSISSYQCAVYLNSEVDKNYSVYVIKLIRRLFNVDVRVFYPKNDKVMAIIVHRVNLVKYLQGKGLFLGNKVHLQVGVPTWIWSKPEYIKACIRGLIDTDGCFAIHRYVVNDKQYSYSKIVFTNRSNPLLEFVYQGLKSLGYNPKKAGKYRVWLYSRKDVERYFKDIGTRNYKKSFFVR